jgi:predicted aldo/keto reductase-like oxidoreductase
VKEKVMGTRRKFLGVAAATVVSTAMNKDSFGDDKKREFPYRTLGRTGERVSLIGLGGYHLGKPDLQPEESIRIIRTALDEGINFLDNCWDYNSGESEVRMGKALGDGYREKAFLMTKIDGRTAKAASQQIDESLKRLKTDHVDLLQFHEVIRTSDPDRIFAKGGAMEAMLKAKQAGKVRYIGFTGHKSPKIHQQMLETAFKNKFTFDAVQMPLNVMDAHYDGFEKLVLPILIEHNIGVLAMKPMGDHFILSSQTVTPIECLHYPMSLPSSVVITGCDSMPILQEAIKAARTFKPFSAQQRSALLAKTAVAAKSGDFEKYKTSHHFDGTYKNPQWLG